MLFCLLAAPTVAEYREQVRQALRSDTPHIILGLLIVALGLGAISAFFLRRKTKDPAPFWFGLFALLYGARLLINTDVVPFALSLHQATAPRIDRLITYLIMIPGVTFCLCVFTRWKSALRWQLRFLIVFAGASILADLLLPNPAILQSVNNVVVLVTLVWFGTALFRAHIPLAGSGALNGMVRSVVA